MLRDSNMGYLRTVVVISICILFLLMLLGIGGILIPAILIIGAGLIFSGCLPASKWSAIDWIFTAITIFVLLSPVYSLCRIPAFESGIDFLILWGMYIFLRKIFSVSPRYSVLVIDGYGLVAMFSSVIAIITFAICVAEAREVGFIDMYPLRYLYRPLGFTNNSWGEMALLLTGFSFMLPKYRGIALYITLTAALLSFSRGTYISLIVLILFFLLFLRPLRKYSSAGAGILLAVVSVMMSFPDEMYTTLSMVGTQSQQSSIEWRENTTLKSMKLAANNPFFGFGNRTFSLVINKGKTDDTDEPFTNCAPNILSQIAIEGGLTGILLISALYVFLFVYVFRNRHNPKVVIIGGIFLSLLFKELAQATISHTIAAQFLCMTLLAIMQRYNQSGDQKTVFEFGRGSIFGFVWLIFAFVSVGLSGELIRDKDSILISNGISCLKSGDISGAIKKFESTSECIKTLDPNINRLLSYSYMMNNRLNEAVSLQRDYFNGGGIDLWMKGKCVYVSGNKEKACSIWTESIFIMPSLINTKDFCALQQSDPESVIAIKKRIKSKREPTAAIEKARYGYILYYLDNKETAKTILAKAISEYPTLQTPYLLLGDTAVYNFLRNGALCPTYPNAPANSVVVAPYENCEILKKILDKYALPLKEWYSINLENL